MSKSLIYVGVISLLHYIIYWVFFLVGFSSGMAFALDGIEPDLAEVLSIKVAHVLELPLIPIFMSNEVFRLDGLWGHITLFLNSIVWGLSLYLIFNSVPLLYKKMKRS